MRKESGLTIAEYCRANSIQPSKYYYWLKRVRQAACDQLPTPLSKPDNPIVPVTFEEPDLKEVQNYRTSQALSELIKMSVSKIVQLYG